MTVRRNHIIEIFFKKCNINLISYRFLMKLKIVIEMVIIIYGNSTSHYNNNCYQLHSSINIPKNFLKNAL